MYTTTIPVLFTIVFSANLAYAQELLWYRYSIVDKDLINAGLSIILDSATTDSAKAARWASLPTVAFRPPFHERNLSYFLYNHWGLPPDLPIFYDTPFDSLPTRCILYETWRKTVGPSFLQKRNNTHITLLYGPVLFEPFKTLTGRFQITNRTLLLEDSRGQFISFLSYGDQPTEYLTPFGRVIFVQTYDSVQFLNQTFRNVHEFHFLLADDYYESEFLLWFNDSFDLIRREDDGHGMVKLPP